MPAIAYALCQASRNNIQRVSGAQRRTTKCINRIKALEHVHVCTVLYCAATQYSIYMVITGVCKGAGMIDTFCELDTKPFGPVQ